MLGAETLIPSEESILVEFKDFSGGISVSELSKTLCAFANTDGGSVYIGVTDQRQIRGLSVKTPILDHIQNAAREGCIPPISIKLHKIPLHDSKIVLQISVERTGHLHSITSGQTYVRVGTQDKKIVGDELLRLAETKTQISYEETLLEAGMEVIDTEALNQYYEARKKVSSFGKRLSPEELLIKIGLAARVKNNFRIKAGAFILFGKENDETLLQRDFTFVRYDREGGMYIYREDISMPAARLLNRLIELIRPFSKKTEGTKGLLRTESTLYPEEAIREALLNAFAHRDYRIQGLKNECRLYPDRLEIISAGGLPSFITLDNMDQRHYSRNPKIMHALLISGLTEELGQGISLIKNALKKSGNPPPNFLAQSDQVKVVFRAPPRRLEKREVKEVLKNYFENNNQISRQQMESLLGLGTTSTKYIIQDLIEEKFLEVIGKGPATRYKNLA